MESRMEIEEESCEEVTDISVTLEGQQAVQVIVAMYLWDVRPPENRVQWRVQKVVRELLNSLEEQFQNLRALMILLSS